MDDIYELQFQKEELERENGLLRARVAMLEAICEKLQKERDDALKLAAV